MYEGKHGCMYISTYKLMPADMFWFLTVNTCFNPPPVVLPPVKSIVMTDVTGPPPISPPVLRMVFRMEFSMLPYVCPCPRSMAWMKQKVIAPVDVILDKACSYEQESISSEDAFTIG